MSKILHDDVEVTMSLHIITVSNDSETKLNMRVQDASIPSLVSKCNSGDVNYYILFLGFRKRECELRLASELHFMRDKWTQIELSILL
jgi:hypothetical protein